MRVRDEDLRDAAHLHAALLDLVLGRLAAVEQPDVAAEAQGE